MTLRTSPAIGLFCLVACGGSGPHGSASFSASPVAARSVLGFAYFERVPAGRTSGSALFYEGDVGCGSTPRCGYTGGSLYLRRVVDGGMLPLVAGEYPVEGLAFTPDAGPGVEQRYAILSAVMVSASSKGGSQGPGPSTESELGCNITVTSASDGGTVTVLPTDGGGLSAVIEAHMAPSPYQAFGPSYEGMWRGRFDAESCP